MTMSLAVGASVATTSCASLRQNAEATPESEKCNIKCILKCEHGNGLLTIDNCPGCGMG